MGRQKKGSADDLTSFQGEIEESYRSWSSSPNGKSMPVVARAIRIEDAEAQGKVTPYSQDVMLPNTKHDLGLVTKMLNYMREQKQLQAIKQPLFMQPDEISLARKEGKINFEAGKIISQVSVVLQRGAIMYVGFVFGRDYVILQN